MVRTQKNGKRVYLGVRKALRAVLDAGPHGKPGVLTFITSEYGLPYTKESLGNWFRDNAVKPVGLVKRSAHGLRKAAARRFAELGANEATLNSIFGWSNPRMAALLRAAGRHEGESVGVRLRSPTSTIPAEYCTPVRPKR